MKPRNVKAAADAADAQILALQEGKATADSTDPAQAEPPALEIVPTAPLAQEPILETAPDNVTEQLDALSADLATMTSRWKSQEGILKGQSKQIEQYQELLANMAQNKQAEPAPAPAPATPVYTSEQADIFGEDMAEFVAEICRKVVRAEVAGISQNVAGLQNTVATTSQSVAVTANELFERKLDELADGWRVLDEDPVFMEWLQARPVFGNAIAAASQALDHNAAAEIFNTYTTLTGQEQAEKNQPALTRQQELESQVQPGKARQLPTPAKNVPEEKIWLMSEIQAVYKAHQSHAGKPAYTADEFAALETEIALAQQEERVDWTR